MGAPRLEDAVVGTVTAAEILGTVPRLEDLVVGTVTAAEVLEMATTNAAKALARRGVKKQIFRLGDRDMAIYARRDVERIAREREADDRRREADEKRRVSARANVALRRAKAVAANGDAAPVARLGKVQEEDLGEVSCRFCDRSWPTTAEFWYRNNKTGGLHLGSRCRACERERRLERKEKRT